MNPGRIDTSGNAQPLTNNPFAALSPAGLPDRPATPPTATPGPPSASIRKQPNRDRGRVDLVRQTAGRGGKTVTVISGFKGIAERELQELARAIQRAAGVGGTVKGRTIEIQGDQRHRAETILLEAGFKPVRAGG